MAVPLNSRAEILLKTLIEQYIADGTPVGSRTLAAHAGLDLSSATIRNVMADLEAMGLIRAPHTSAGRVPTQAGYRLFVDSLLSVKDMDLSAVTRLEGEFANSADQQHVIANASNMLSQLTHLAAVVSVPKEELSAFRQIEFVRLSAKRILVILIAQDGQVQNRVFNSGRKYSDAELVQAANYFNAEFAGRSLAEVKHVLLKEMKTDSETMQKSMRMAVEMAQQVFDDPPDDGLVVSGESNLIDIPDLGDVKTLRRLFDVFGTKRDLLHLLDQSIKCSGVNIFIGRESGYEALEDCSVVTASYKIDDKMVGTLGVIGPTRMSYERVIPIVDITAKLISGALNSENE
jgi:heat-inducible transcriptional repressor